MGYSKNALYKSIVLLILISALMFMGIPLNYGRHISYGSSGGGEDQYIEYIVKRGDTLMDISKRFNVDISQLTKDNNIKNKNHIYVGQKLKIQNGDNPKGDGLEATDNIDTDIPENLPNTGPDLISLNMQNVDIRDVISAIVYHMDAYALFIEDEPTRVNFQIKNATPYRALELLLQSVELNYIEDNNLIIIGKAERLKKDFFNQMTITRFDLTNISAKSLEGQIKNLEIPIQTIIMDRNPNTIWVQGTPPSLAKVKELISALDIAKASSDQYTVFLFKLKNIAAKDAAERLESFGYENVDAITFGYPEFGRDILIICPSTLKTRVTLALEGLDLRGLGHSPHEVMLPVDSATGPFAYDILESRRSLLIDIMDELKNDRNMIDVSENLWTEDGDEYRVLLVRSTPEIITKVKEMIKLIDSP